MRVPLDRVYLTDPTEHPHDPGIYLPDVCVKVLPAKARLYAMRGFSAALAVYDTVRNEWPGHYVLPEGETVRQWIDQGRAWEATMPVQDW